MVVCQHSKVPPAAATPLKIYDSPGLPGVLSVATIFAENPLSVPGECFEPFKKILYYILRPLLNIVLGPILHIGTIFHVRTISQIDNKFEGASIFVRSLERQHSSGLLLISNEHQHYAVKKCSVVFKNSVVFSTSDSNSNFEFELVP